jgi:hypothetical protein
MTEFSENDGLNKVLTKVLDNKSLHELDSIRDQEMKIEAFLKTKTSKEGETQPCGGPPSNIVKVSGFWTLYTKARYILVVDGYFFNHCDDNTVEGMVFNALQKIDVKIVKGEIKLATRRPDIEFFAATVAHYGPISEALIALKECFAHGTRHFVNTIASGKLEETPPANAQPPAEEPPLENTATMEQPKRRGGRKQ